MTKQEILKTHFGYDTFREGQEAVIDALLAEKDVLAVMPTGAGKSICYQVPALMMKGSGNSRRAAFPLPPIRSPLTLSEHHLVHLQLDLVEIRLHRGELRRGFLV